jgi:hypothetical protein
MTEAFGEPQVPVRRDRKTARIIQPAQQNARIVQRGSAAHDPAERVKLHQIDAPIRSWVAGAAIADEDHAIGCDGDGCEAMQRPAFGFVEQGFAP